MKIKYDIVIDSDRIDDHRVLVTATTIPTPRIKESFQRSVDVSVVDIERTSTTASEDEIRGAAEAFGFYWMMVYGGIIPHEHRADGSKPLDGRFFRLQFQHAEAIQKGWDYASSNLESRYKYDGSSPTGIAGALLYGRFNRAIVTGISEEGHGISSRMDLELRHFEQTVVYYRNRVEEQLPETQWGRLTVPFKAYGKAYSIHKKTLAGMNVESYAKPSPYSWLFHMMVRRQWQLADPQEYELLLRPYQNKDNILRAEVWCITNPSQLSETDWVVTITSEDINGKIVRYVADINRVDQKTLKAKSG